MTKNIVSLIVSLTSLIFLTGFFYVSLKLFKYFGYWGLGASIILLFIILITLLLVVLLAFILHYKRGIKKIIIKLIDWLKSSLIWQKLSQKMRKNWPRFYQFTEDRLNKNLFLGLYFTLGLFVSLIFFFFFLNIIIDIIFKQPLGLADLRIISLFQTIVSDKLNYLFIFFTSLANLQNVLVISLTLIIYLLIIKNYRAIKYFIITIGTGLLLLPLTKILFQRVRPDTGNLIVLPTSFSLPSGHALFAVCLYGFVAYLSFKNYKNITIKIFSAALYLLLIIFIGLSRVYLGVHYFSDVLAGWYLGLVILTITITFFELENKFYPKKLKATEINPLKKYIVLIILLIIIAFSVKNSFTNIKIIAPVTVKTTISLNDFLKNITPYSENLFGDKMEPFNFIIIGDKQKIIQLFAKPGWYLAEPPTLKTFFLLSSGVAKNNSYPTAPMTPAFYNGKTNDLGFEKPTALNSARQRHHTRYWQSNYQINNNEIWVATASFDRGVEIGQIIKLPTHQIDPDIDAEREFIIIGLLKTGLISSYKKIDLVGKKTGKNAAGDKFFTDGKAYLIYL